MLARAVVTIIFFAMPSLAFPQAKPLSRERLRSHAEKDIRILRDPVDCYVQAGFPEYTGLFGRDSLIVSWELIDYDPTIARCTLAMLVKFQGEKVDPKTGEEPGKILHEWHKPEETNYERDWSFPYYGSADSTPLFIYVSGLYFEKTCEKTCDHEWLSDMWPHIEAALAWCETYGNLRGDGFIAYERKTPIGLFHQGWKDADDNHLKLAPPVAMVEIQGYYYAALLQATEMARATGKNVRAQKLLAEAALLKKNFINTFWLADKQWLAFALDKNNADPRVASNQGQILFSGILDGEPEKAVAVAARLFQSDMWTPFGIRTYSSANEDFDPFSYHLGSIWPHDNWIIAQGLKRLGLTDEYARVKNAQIAAARILHGDLPELYFVKNGKLIRDPEACVPQGWASGGLLNFLTSE